MVSATIVVAGGIDTINADGFNDVVGFPAIDN